MTEDEQTLRDALQAELSEPEDSKLEFAVEIMGDKAFDWIVERIRADSLAPRESVKALRLLSRLTRQFCSRRKGELLDLVLMLSRSEDVHLDVRSAAAHIATANASIAMGLRETPALYGRSPKNVQIQVSEAVRRALEIGVSPEIEGSLREMLTADRGESDAEGSGV
jgi:hypothetical protein